MYANADLKEFHYAIGPNYFVLLLFVCVKK